MAPYVILLKPTTLVTLVGTVVMFSALPMLGFASYHHRSLKFDIGEGGGGRGGERYGLWNMGVARGVPTTQRDEDGRFI